MASDYHAAVLRVIETIERTQGEALERAADDVFRSLRADGVLHVFGSGHSHAVAEEAFHRAGGLVPVNAIQEAFLTPLTPPALSGQLERLPDLGRLILATHDLRAGEVLMVISHSGINAVPVDAALEGKSRGLTIVAVTSGSHSLVVESRHPSGKPTSLLAGCYLVNSLVCRVVERYLSAGLVPPVYMSANVPGGDEHNRALEERYRGRIRGL
jgi:uncharacterized phosphosugar-binding protein